MMIDILLLLIFQTWRNFWNCLDPGTSYEKKIKKDDLQNDLSTEEYLMKKRVFQNVDTHISTSLEKLLYALLRQNILAVAVFWWGTWNYECDETVKCD